MATKNAKRAARALGYYNLGTSLIDSGRPEEAIPQLEAARALDAGNRHIHNNLGIALQDSGRLEEAERSFRAAIEIDPGFADAYANLHALLIGREPAKAIDALERALRVRPDDLGLRFFLGTLLEAAGDARAKALLESVAAGDDLDRARLDAWRYIRGAAGSARMVGTRAETFRIAMEAARLEGLVLEFGVHFGASLRQIAALARQPVHGFDSFQGLPEDWHGEPRGSYSTGGALPTMPANVTLHAGWFADTLPAFVARQPGPVRLAHVDCDLYSSTRTVLGELAGRIVAGSVLVFDEYLAHRQWREDEFRAFHEECARRGWRYEYLCYSVYSKQAAVRIAG